MTSASATVAARRAAAPPASAAPLLGRAAGLAGGGPAAPPAAGLRASLARRAGPQRTPERPRRREQRAARPHGQAPFQARRLLDDVRQFRCRRPARDFFRVDPGDGVAPPGRRRLAGPPARDEDGDHVVLANPCAVPQRSVRHDRRRRQCPLRRRPLRRVRAMRPRARLADFDAAAGQRIDARIGAARAAR